MAGFPVEGVAAAGWDVDAASGAGAGAAGCSLRPQAASSTVNAMAIVRVRIANVSGWAWPALLQTEPAQISIRAAPTSDSAGARRHLGPAIGRLRQAMPARKPPAPDPGTTRFHALPGTSPGGAPG